jgi:hypothetical protein
MKEILQNLKVMVEIIKEILVNLNGQKHRKHTIMIETIETMVLH